LRSSCVIAADRAGRLAGVAADADLGVDQVLLQHLIVGDVHALVSSNVGATEGSAPRCARDALS